MIGISLAQITSMEKTQIDPSREGAVVRHVIRNGPADKGGLKTNDVIIAVNDKEMKDPQDVINAINDHGVNSPLSFIIKRKKFVRFIC